MIFYAMLSILNVKSLFDSRDPHGPDLPWPSWRKFQFPVPEKLSLENRNIFNVVIVHDSHFTSSVRNQNNREFLQQTCKMLNILNVLA